MHTVGVTEMKTNGDKKKAIELIKMAADLGLCSAHFSMGVAYNQGEGVEVDLDKCKYHWETAAKAGHGDARRNLAIWEAKKGNSPRAMKHLMVAAKCGYKHALDEVKDGFVKGHLTRYDFEETLRVHKLSLAEMRSDQRDKAAAQYPFTPSMLEGSLFNA